MTSGHRLHVVEEGASPSWFGHPPGLTILFLTQTWECFSFYGMRALLVYYMINQLGFPQQKASLIYGSYTALIFLTPIVGGAVADRWLGRHLAVVIGAATMALGHFMMTFASLFYPALLTIVVGSGFFMPNLPSQIKELYAADDRRREVSYNVYYVGVNTGGFLAPLACGYIGERFGWHWGFGLAGIGMVIGLCVYLAGGRWLPVKEHEVADHDENPSAMRDVNKSRWLLLMAVGFAVVLFRGAYEQLGNTIAVWAATGVDRTLVGGFVVPMTWFQSLNPLFVIAFTPLVIGFWRYLAGRGIDLSAPRRMAVGAWIVAAAYLALATLAAMAPEGRAPGASLALVIIAITLGELWILPVGLGLFGRLAPAGLTATLIAAWYFAGFAGNLLSGALGSFWIDLGAPRFFALMGILAVVAGVLLFLLDRSARKLDEDLQTYRG